MSIQNLLDAIHDRFSELGGVELDLPRRSTRVRAAEFQDDRR
jgi:hypothetical protein